MELEKIEQLVKILERSTLQTMTVEDGDFKIEMSKLEHPPIVAPGAVAAPVLQSAVIPQAVPTPEPEVEEEEVNIVSPIVGTFYSAAGPTLPAYVKVGDKVKTGETVCIVEAMKMMNEITAEFDCEIEAVLVSNEQKVEYGQPMFRVRKL